MPQVDVLGILHTAAFLLGAMAILFAGKLARDFLAKGRGHRVGDLITLQDNPATAIEQAGFLMGAVLGLLGSLALPEASILVQAGELALTGLIVIATLLLNDQLMSRVVCRGFDNHAEVNDNHNVAVAVPRAAGAIATGLVLRAALGHDSALLDRLGWVLIGQTALVGISLLYQWRTPYDDLAEIKGKNLAAGLPMAGVLLAVAITVEAALRGEGHGWVADLQSVGLDLALSIVLLQVLRVVADAFLLPGTTLAKEIAVDRNVGAGVMELASLLVGAFMLAYFLN